MPCSPPRPRCLLPGLQGGWTGARDKAARALCAGAHAALGAGLGRRVACGAVGPPSRSSLARPLNFPLARLLLQLGILGSGTYGLVIRARDTSDPEAHDVAIKLLPRGGFVSAPWRRGWSPPPRPACSAVLAGTAAESAAASSCSLSRILPQLIPPELEPKPSATLPCSPTGTPPPPPLAHTHGLSLCARPPAHPPCRSRSTGGM